MYTKKHIYSFKKKYDLVIISYYKYPCYHPVLENVFAKYIGSKINILWFLKGDKIYGKRYIWHNSDVLIVNINENNKHIIKKIIIKIINTFLICLNLIKVVKKYKCKIILVRDMPALTILIAIFKKLLKIKIFYQYSSPQGCINIAHFKKKRNIRNVESFFKGVIFNIFNNYAIKCSDLIIPISQYHEIEIRKFAANKKLIPLTMGVDENWVIKKRMFIKELKVMKNGDLWITYFGSLGRVRNPIFMLQIYAIVYKSYPASKLLLIGKYEKDIYEEIIKVAKKLNFIKNIILLGHIDRNELRNYLWYTDICLSPIPPTNYYVISSPTKLYESMGFGIPVVANKEIKEQEKVIKMSGGGIIVKYNHVEFANAVIMLIRDNKLRDTIGNNGKNYILKNYSYKKLSDDIIQEFL